MEEKPESLKHRIKAKLRSAALHEEKKYLLLVLDVEGNKMKDNDSPDIFRAALPSSDCNPLKILITKRKSEEAPIIIFFERQSLFTYGKAEEQQTNHKPTSPY